MPFYSKFTPYYTRKTKRASGRLKKIILNLSLINAKVPEASFREKTEKWKIFQ
jgi:hypothetical protein